MELILPSFTAVVNVRGLTHNWIRLYTCYCSTLVEYFGGPRRIDASDVLEWIAYAQSELEWNPRTINLALASFRVLIESVGRPSVTAGVRTLRFDHPEAVVLSASESAALFQATQTLTMRTGVLLLYGAGLGLSEMVTLRLRDLHSSRGVLRIERPMNLHARDASLRSTSLRLLREVWKARRALGPVALQDPIFV